MIIESFKELVEMIINFIVDDEDFIFIDENFIAGKDFIAIHGKF